MNYKSRTVMCVLRLANSAKEGKFKNDTLWHPVCQIPRTYDMGHGTSKFTFTWLNIHLPKNLLFFISVTFFLASVLIRHLLFSVSFCIFKLTVNEVFKKKTPVNLINRRSELVSKCRRKNKFYLINYKAIPPDS